jgi:hypothetical protein
VLVVNLENQTFTSFEHGLSRHVVGVVGEADGRHLSIADRDQLVTWSVDGLQRVRSLDLANVVAFVADYYNGKIAVAHSKRKWVEGSLESLGADLGGKHEAAVMVADSSSGESRMLLSDTPFLQALAFHPDGDRLATGHGEGSVNLWDLAAGASRPVVWPAHAGGVLGIAYTSDGRFLATTGLDAAIRLWCTASNRLAATLISHDDANFVAVTAEGYYACTQGGLPSVVFRHAGRAFPFDQFDLTLNRPDLVHETLGYVESDLIDLYADAYRRRVRRMGFTPEQLSADFQVPALELVSAPPPAATSERQLTMRVRATPGAHPLDRLLVSINEVPTPAQGGVPLSGGPATAEAEVAVTLSAGNNRIRLSAIDSAGVESFRENHIVTVTAPPSRTSFLLAIGVSVYQDPHWNLRFANKDAKDLARELEARLINYRSFKKRVLTDRKVTRAAVLKARDFLAQSKVDDQVILFLAGHGVLRDNEYYFLPSDVRLDDLRTKAIRYEDIESLLDGIAARRRLVLIDTCHAGEPDELEPATPMRPPVGNGVTVRDLISTTELPKDSARPARFAGGLLSELFADLRRGSGAVVIAASGSAEFAFEQDDLRNGVFTHCILEALRGGLPVNVSALQRHVNEQVVALTGGRQRPATRNKNYSDDFPVV